MENNEKIYLASYLFDNNDKMSVEWGIQFHAKDMEEAKERIKAIKDTLKLDGELDEIIYIE